MDNNNIYIYAMYLPQYHEIPENSQFWGKGFTDWVTVKKAKPLFDGHKMPKVPLDDNYYDLSKKESVKWQADLAKKYGIDGFGIYHYWFSSKHNILTKPAEIILNNKDINISYFYAWDNTSWKRTWSAVKGNDWAPSMDTNSDKTPNSSGILIQYELGSVEEWDKHFYYLLPYFKDARYARKNNMPVFMIFNYEYKLKEMEKRWQALAKENTLEGIYFIYREDSIRSNAENNSFDYEPIYAGWGSVSERILLKLKSKVGINALQKYSYDKIWRRILDKARKDSNPDHYPGVFVSYDDTARRGKRGKIVIGGNPKKFYLYMRELIKTCQENQKDMIFLTAWNEWSEGAYLEPDTANGYGYLKALHKAKKDNGLC